MRTAIAAIKEMNQSSREWVAQDPQNRWSGIFSEDPAHWEKYGIITEQDFMEHLDSEHKRNMRKERY